MSNSPGAPILDGLVHGMGKELVEPDWPALTDAEVRAVLAHYELPPDELPPGELPLDKLPGAVSTWHSPRPMSAAALVTCQAAAVFVKRHHLRVRNVDQLTVEHAFAAHLRERGVPVPAVLRDQAGRTAVCLGDWVYEVHQAAAGTDLYRDAMSWTPFRSRQHARAAGVALARLHLAAASFPLPERPPAALLGSAAVVAAADPRAALAQFTARLPAATRYLARRSWQQDFERYLATPIARAAPALAALPRQWGHGDWHPSNLTWTEAGAEVAAVLDLGLANRTSAVHDLATAIERSIISWLDLTDSGPADSGPADSGDAEADLDALDALLDGYESVRPLTPREAAALAETVPVVHVEFALTEIEYFAGITAAQANADLAYESYLLGHARWFARSAGQALLAHLRHRAA